MSKKGFKMARSASSQKIREAVQNLHRMSQEKRIDLMVEAKVMPPEQAERAKRKWAEMQAVK